MTPKDCDQKSVTIYTIHKGDTWLTEVELLHIIILQHTVPPAISLKECHGRN